jgi:hypothetical protein
MKRKKVFYSTGLCFMLIIVLLASPLSAGWQDMEVLKDTFDIDVSPRNQWYPWVEYNPIDNEFMVVYRTSGPLRDDCDPGDEYDCLPDLQSIDARRVSPDGVVVGDPLQLSPPEPGHKHAPKIVHNSFTNEYTVVFPRGYETDDMEMNITRTDNLGNTVYGPTSLYPRQNDAALPVVIFNPERREYLVIYGDRGLFNSWQNNIGFILNEDGSKRTGPFPVGNQFGDMYAPLGAYNPTNDTYLVVWEDFRNVPDWIHPCDLYGALLDDDGTMITEITIVDDFGMEDEGDARVPNIAYNPDKNEFLVVWEVKKMSLDKPGLMGVGIRGRIINADGSLAGPAFTIIDEPRIQHWPSIVYVQDEKKYFMAWTDTRDDGLPPGEPWYTAPDMDCYAIWLDDTGTPIGDEIPISTGDNWQMSGVVSYNPVEKRFLITWYDRQATNIGNTPFAEAPSSVRATLYGMPSFLTVQVVEEGTGNPVEGALALVVGPSLPAFRESNVGGWFNIEKGFQFNGPYLVMVFKAGYKMALELVNYRGEPQELTVMMNPR